MFVLRLYWAISLEEWVILSILGRKYVSEPSQENLFWSCQWEESRCLGEDPRWWPALPTGNRWELWSESLGRGYGKGCQPFGWLAHWHSWSLYETGACMKWKEVKSLRTIQFKWNQSLCFENGLIYLIDTHVFLLLFPTPRLFLKVHFSWRICETDLLLFQEESRKIFEERKQDVGGASFCWEGWKAVGEWRKWTNWENPKGKRILRT